MQLKGEKQLEKWQKENGLPVVCLLYGEDGYLIQRYQERLMNMAVTAFPDFNLYRADGRTAVDMDDLCDSAMSLPFMSESRGVLLDDLDLSAQDSASLDKLFDLIKNPSGSTCLTITVRTTSLDLKKKGSKGGKLRDLCDKAGVVCEFTRPGRSDVARAASNKAAQLGSKLDSGAAGLLADYCGGDILRALGEVDKLTAYCNTHEITEAAVQLLVEPVTEAKVFDLSAKLLRKDLDGAMGIVNDLFFLRENPVSILTILSMSFTDLYRAAAARRSGVPAPQAQKELGYFGGSAYRYQKALENQSRLDSTALGAIILLLAQADSSMKESGANQAVILETVVTNIWLCLTGAAV